MTGIFINYRRDDVPGVAGRLYDRLSKSFSRRDLFMDVDAIKAGLDFVKQLDSQVSRCDVLLALIGPHWLVAENEEGQRRLHDDHDYVRIEIAAALKRDIPVIPVLIDGAAMPDEDKLPEDLKSLTLRQALELRHTRFAADADAIVAALKDCLPGHRKKRVWAGVAAACLLGAVGLGTALYFWSGSRLGTPVVTQPTAMAPSNPEVVAPQPVNPQSIGVSDGSYRLVVMGEDGDASVVRRTSDIYRRVINELRRPLAKDSFDLVDEDSLAAILGFDYKAGMTKTDILRAVNIANSAISGSNRVRFLSLMRVHVFSEDLGFTKQVHVRLAGELYDLGNDRFVDYYETNELTFPVPLDCNQACVVETAGGRARDLALVLGEILSKQLKAYIDSRGEPVPSSVTAP